jgi:hypothetical protein
MAMLGPWTEAKAMLEPVVVVAVCQHLFEQILCETAGQGGTLKEGLVFPQVQIKEGQGKADAWAAESGTAVSQLSL